MGNVTMVKVFMGWAVAWSSGYGIRHMFERSGFESRRCILDGHDMS